MIRNATADDAAQIAAFWNPIVRDTDITFWPTERSEAEIASLISDRQAAGYAFVVAEDAGGTIMGFTTYSQFRNGLGYSKSFEHSIILAPEARGRGIGSALLAAVERHVRNRDGRLLIGAITASNEGSLRFHQRNGYAEWGRIPAAGWKFGRFHDLVLMGKDLGN